eukprot:CAMPEP_0115633272 /NCGR_PEP_ID=MMETSP0272-20121206/31960_1 /TAXON_ID=71861 /ORGANISM="Scrippsiella trochoidea, Strain CCMP3099" /LENGTH=58 /DNA_ID=CAMNT_0003070025 /DNA_START=99 /DNA_END=275 /DNA_ORIENTATION=-
MFLMSVDMQATSGSTSKISPCEDFNFSNSPSAAIAACQGSQEKPGKFGPATVGRRGQI